MAPYSVTVNTSSTIGAEKLLGRIVAADDEGVDLDVDGRDMRVAFGDITKAVVKAELRKDPAIDEAADEPLDADDSADLDDSADPDESDDPQETTRPPSTTTRASRRPKGKRVIPATVG